MTRKQTIALLDDWLKMYNAVDGLFMSVRKLTNADGESAFAQVLFQCFGGYTKTLSKLIDDQGEWLSWFIWENECGKKAGKCTPKAGCKPFAVHNTRTLEKVIRLHRN